LNLFIRSAGYVLGVAWWVYLSVPRYDTERRRTSRYRKLLGIVRMIWIGACCAMLLLITSMPAVGIPLSLALSLLTAFVSFVILDETE
jgi:hypothetical protein